MFSKDKELKCGRWGIFILNIRNFGSHQWNLIVATSCTRKYVNGNIDYIILYTKLKIHIRRK